MSARALDSPTPLSAYRPQWLKMKKWDVGLEHPRPAPPTAGATLILNSQLPVNDDDDIEERLSLSPGFLTPSPKRRPSNITISTAPPSRTSLPRTSDRGLVWRWFLRELSARGVGAGVRRIYAFVTKEQPFVLEVVRWFGVWITCSVQVVISNVSAGERGGLRIVLPRWAVR